MRLVRYSFPFRTLAPASNGFQRSPWSGLESEIDRLFESALTTFGDSTSVRVPVDLYEDKDNAYVRAELPGFSRDEINVEMVDGYLSLTAKRKSPAGQDAPEEMQTVTRSVSIPEDVQADRVAATYEHGVLLVTLPKREETKPKKITVAVK